MSSLVMTSRRERDQLLATAPPALHHPLVSSLVALHRALVSASVVDAGLDHVRGLVRRTGRRLEDQLDVAAAPSQQALVSQIVEPDLLPTLDAIAAFLGKTAQPGSELGDLGDAVAVVVEEDVGPAVLALGMFSFEVPRCRATVFDPRRHQLVERGSGPKDVVVELVRFGRVARGGRLVEPSLVVVGDGQ